MSALALAFHKKGIKVTGSDRGFYPPVSTSLEQEGISFYAGWHPEKMLENAMPDLVVVGTSSGSGNPETKVAKEKGIEILSDAEVRGKFFAKENSILAAGTWGKTTSTALLSHILKNLDKKPSYMIGGVPIDMDAAELVTGPPAGGWSVIEADEYKSGPEDTKAKFDYIPVTHLLLSGVSWDHMDVYPTEDSYFVAFIRLIERVPKNGLVVACIDHPGVRRVLGHARARVVTYGKQPSADYQYVKIAQSPLGLRFGIVREREAYAIESDLFGDFQAENITGCFAMAREIGLSPKEVLMAITDFKGIRRRLEKRFESKNVTVIDDIAHSPDKARATLRTLRAIYPSHKIIAVFEPNIGSRSAEAATKYTDAFSAADIVIIPQLTKLKIDPEAITKPLEGHDLTQLIARGHSAVQYIPKDDKLVEQITSLAAGPLSESDEVVIVFLGSHSFRQMIEQVVEKLKVERAVTL